MIRGRAGRRVPKNPRSRRASRHGGDPESLKPQVRHHPTSRTRCLRLAPQSPRWITFSGPFGPCPPLVEALRRAAVGSAKRAFGQSPQSDAQTVRRDRVAWAAGTRSDVSLRSGTGHRSPPRVRNTADAPRMGRDGADIAPRHLTGERRRASVTDIQTNHRAKKRAARS